ncbi:MAG: threonine synthase [Anaerolineales bacterium]|nr:threonine synthase [Anaerolineales bacterium]
MSYLTDLKCTECSHSFDPNLVQTFCPECQSPLLAHYDLEGARQSLDREQMRQRPAGMWRWRELLPVHDPENMLSLGEGDTPLLHVRNLGDELGLSQLYVKDESVNPTGTFKARGLAAAVSKAKELGIQKVIIPTAGNAGGAMAAYAARGGLEACIFMPHDTPLANIEESRITGAEVIMVNGLISDAAAMAEEKAQAEGWFSVSTFKEPYRTEGKKVMGYELAEQFSWELPEVIIYPTGGGTGLVGMWKAFAELEKLGWLEGNNRPRLVAVQAAGCAPVVEAFEVGATNCEFWEGAQTIASGIRVPKSFADRKMLQDIRESNGTAVSVSDEEILTAQRHLGRTEGIFAAPEGAATLAGLYKLIERGWIQSEERIVLFNTGSGLKYIHK